MRFDVLIAVDAGAWPDEATLEALAERAAATVGDMLELPDGESEISLLFTDDAAIRSLNAQWLGKDQPTNVLSFPPVQLAPGDRPGPLAGDIVFGYETVAREADIDGKAFADHLVHLTVHGMMHLLGYDHETDDDAEQMETLETAILERLGIADPYAARGSEPKDP